jgi:hypothetical protein
VNRIDPIAPDRSVQRVDLTYLTPLEREREKERRERERERKRRQNPPSSGPAPRSEDGSGGLDVRA